MLLEYSPAYAASIAQAKIIPCPGALAPEVRELLAQGLNAARGVQSHFVRFQKQATDTERANLWNNGPEYTWFAAYDKHKYRSLQGVFNRISPILSSPRLDVICDDTDKGYAHALPGIWKIHLGIKWINDTDREERIQTFVHEAAHIAGREALVRRNECPSASLQIPSAAPVYGTAQCRQYRLLRNRFGKKLSFLYITKFFTPISGVLRVCGRGGLVGPYRSVKQGE